MANRTVKDANSIHGTNPQYLVEKIIRTRIYESKYWKEECFGLTAELVVDKAMELKYVGGVYGGNIKPTPFLCLTLKMLQIQPEKDIIVEFIKNEDFKSFSLHLFLFVSEFEVMHVDEFIDELLHAERMCDIILPRLQKRQVLEEAEMLDPRVSALEEDLDEVESSEEEDEEEEKPERLQTPEPHRRGYRDNDRPRRSPSPRYRRSRSPRRRSRSPKRRSLSPRRDRHRSKSPRRHRSRSRDRRHRSKSPGHHRSHRHRSHSKSPERSSKKSHKKSRRGNE
ncbi:pre-mRNA-splicing factor 38A [Stegastes partitus]|uniref:Pre-mRNA-splicing factor 38A n=1 Tax=Stegastes partitus TaxID=144197 RepID=A0A9Y4JLE2_9TELE|nr:PREDICTED: pre-mRNA-splicing factor 38A [Stegastes partitus]